MPGLTHFLWKKRYRIESISDIIALGTVKRTTTTHWNTHCYGFVTRPKTSIEKMRRPSFSLLRCLFANIFWFNLLANKGWQIVWYIKQASGLLSFPQNLSQQKITFLTLLPFWKFTLLWKHLKPKITASFLILIFVLFCYMSLKFLKVHT